MERPCYCDNLETCHLCKLYHTDERYKLLWSDPPKRLVPPEPGEATAYDCGCKKGIRDVGEPRKVK